MNILITGGTGFIGKALIPHLSSSNITVLSRNIAHAYQIIGHHITAVDNLDKYSNFNEFDAIINLAGEPIIDKRWTDKQKNKIKQSRWSLTQQLVEKIIASDNPPHTFISGSAVGIYGDQKDLKFDETLPITSHDDFATQVCFEWEKIALAAQSEQTRVCLLRTGIVLGKKGGALSRMLLPYQLGLGGPIGDGNQYFPWIHIHDMVEGILFLLRRPDAQGAFNFTAPNPVTNSTFSLSFAKTLKRPHFLYTPVPVLKLALGESAQLLLDSQQAIPAKLETLGFHFTYPYIDQALKAILDPFD